MKLETEFYKLPVAFDPIRAYEEISRIDPYRWVPRGNPRYLNLPLVSHHGLDTQHPAPPTWPTSNLDRCPYLRQILATFRSALIDVRVRREEPGSTYSEHYDEHYAGFTRYRLHLPVLNDPRIRFRCNGREVQMERGDVWLFDRQARYGVFNPTPFPRMHISIETSGSSTLWNMIDKAERPFGPPTLTCWTPERIEFHPHWDATVLTENTPAPTVLPPGDLDCFMADLIERMSATEVRDPVRHQDVVRAIRRFQHDWRTLWSLSGPDFDGWSRYRSLATSLLIQVADLERASGGSVSKLEPSVTARLHDFLRTGALNPRMSPYQLDTEATPDRLFELVGEPLLRLRADGTFELWNALHKQYRRIKATDIDLLRWFSTPATVAEAAANAGYVCDAPLLRRMNWFMLQHLVRPLGALPGVAPPDFELPVRTPSTSAGHQEGALSAAESISESGEFFPLRVQDDVYFRLRTASREVYAWVPKLHAFRSLNWQWLRLVAGLASGVPPWEAAAVAGLHYDDQVEAAVAMLLHHGLFVDTLTTAVPRAGASRR